jgi:hypothetical protein
VTKEGDWVRFNVGDRVRSRVPRDFGTGTVVQARGRWGVQLYEVDWRDARGNHKVMSMPEEMLEPATNEAMLERSDASHAR